MGQRVTETILEEAARITSGPRQQAYGNPADNHGCTAAIWSAYLTRKLRMPVHIDARDVCLMQIGVKLSRDANERGRDNLVDIAGWSRNAEMLEKPATACAITPTPFAHIMRNHHAIPECATCGEGTG